jgi:hypothetical protein
MGESFDPTFIASSFWGMMLMRLIVEGTVIVIVPLLVLFMLDVALHLAPVYNLVACISIVYNITQVLVILVSSSAMLLWGSETTGRAPMWALAVVKVLTPHSISMFGNRVHHSNHVQHCLVALNLRVDLLVVLRQEGSKLVDDHPRSQGIVSWRAVDLFSSVFDLAKFLADQL